MTTPRIDAFAEEIDSRIWSFFIDFETNFEKHNILKITSRFVSLSETLKKKLKDIGIKAGVNFEISLNRKLSETEMVAEISKIYLKMKEIENLLPKADD